MRISRNWLSDYLDFSSLSDAEFDDLITTKVAEVDDVEVLGEGLRTAVVAAVLDVQRHPTKDGLNLVKLSLGKDEQTVVCGAPNVEKGMLSVYIPLGGKVRNPKDGSEFTVTARDVGGVTSNGILVSEAELGIGGDHAGIINLKEFPKATAGQKATQILGAPDTVLVIDNKSLTHRADLWGHHGFAREMGAILNKKLELDLDRFADDEAAGEKLLKSLGKGKAQFQVRVEKGSGCRRFAGIEIEGVSATPSPLWLRRRLYAVGAGVRNTIVDLSNYVMHDVGQPNHTYDVAKLQGATVSARLAKRGEKLLTLDGVERELSEEDIVIADAAGAVALGGIMGGERSAVSETTKKLFLESANFDPVFVRHSAKRHGVRTDASNRFEKGRTPYAVPLALHRYVELMGQIQSSAGATAAVTDDFVERPVQIQIPLSYQYVQSRLVSALKEKEIDRILGSLGFTPGKAAKDGVRTFDVPYFRAGKDIAIEDDLVEELGRIYGYEQIPETAPLIAAVPPRKNLLRELEHQLRDVLSGAGLSETYDYSFMNEAVAEKFGFSVSEAVRIQNPVDTNEPILRLSLVPGMCRMIEENARFNTDIALFELGRSYFNAPIDAHGKLTRRAAIQNVVNYERMVLALGYTSGRDESELGAYLQPQLKSGADFYSLLTVIRRTVRFVTPAELEVLPLVANAGGKSADSRRLTDYRAWMHPGRAGKIVCNGLELGVIAEVRPDLISDFSHRAVVAELDLELLLELNVEQQHFKSLSKYPSSLFEISVVMPEQTSWITLRELIFKNVNRDLVRSVDVITVYSGKPIPDGHKSVSVRIVLGADDKTLSTDEVSSFQQGLIGVIDSSEFTLRR